MVLATLRVLGRQAVRRVNRKDIQLPVLPKVIPKATSTEKSTEILPKSWKLPHQERVSFNLSKLSSLSGHDKIDLFKDYLRTHSRPEAIFVYEKLLEIGLLNRLEYKDFHNLFRLLLNVPSDYRKTIVSLRNEIIKNGNLPTVYFDNEYMICLIKWGNIKNARELLDELYKSDKKIDNHSYDIFLKWYLKRGRFDEAMEVIEIMKVAKPLTRPSLSVYLKIMDVHTNLGDQETCKEVYLDGEENLERLYVNHLEATSQESDLRWKVDCKVQLFNAYLNCLASLKDFKGVLKFYGDFKDEGCLVKSKSCANTFHILFKSIHADIKEGGEYSEKDLDGYWGDLVRVSVPDYLHYARYMTLVKSVTVLDELYRNACLTLNISIDGAKRQAVESAYLMSLIDLDFEKGMEEMERVRQSQTRKPMRFVYAKFLGLARERGSEDLVQIWVQKDKINMTGHKPRNVS